LAALNFVKPEGLVLLKAYPVEKNPEGMALYLAKDCFVTVAAINEVTLLVG
jgi:hypothetical protein